MSPPPGSRSSRRFPWLLLVGAVLLIGVYLYSTRSIPGSFEWHEDLDQALATAAEENKLVLIEFYATWCGPCRQMAADVFTRIDVAEALAEWVPVRIDVDRQESVARQYGIQSMPTFFILSPQGKPLLRFEGALSAEGFIEFLQAGDRRYDETSNR